jgi:hypothetical protein
MNIKEKLELEKVELDEKIGNLEIFLGSSPYWKLNKVQQSLLVVQKESMSTYSMCLYCRIENL